MNYPIEEVWKDIPGYEGLYQVSDQGNVKSIRFRKERILKFRKNQGGYLEATLCVDYKMNYHLVHRLVYLIFNNLPLDYFKGHKTKTLVCHKDDDKENNRLINLELGDQLKNNRDKVLRGRQARGKVHGLRMLAGRNKKALISNF